MAKNTVSNEPRHDRVLPGVALRGQLNILNRDNKISMASSEFVVFVGPKKVNFVNLPITSNMCLLEERCNGPR